MKTFKIPEELLLQMRADSVFGIHFRDFISVDVKPDGSYTTDWDAPDKKVVLKEDYIDQMSIGLELWFNSLKSDGAWYTNLDGDWLDVHAEMIQDFVSSKEVV